MISGGIHGVFLYAAPGTVTNGGTITGESFAGVDLFSGGVVNNSGQRPPSRAEDSGVYIEGSSGTVTNDGTIKGTNHVGVTLASGGVGHQQPRLIHHIGLRFRRYGIGLRWRGEQ